jgi:hypothetical protein
MVSVKDFASRRMHLRLSRVTDRLPGRGFRVENTADVPIVLRSILSKMVERR